jgi:hypothetical protein
MQRLRVVMVSLFILAVASGTGSLAVAQGSSELAGAWIVTSWTMPDGEVDSDPQRGLFMFTQSGNYSMMYVNSDEERARIEGEEGGTDAEKVIAYDTFTANSGRYRVSGNTLTYEAYMAKDPNYMAAFGPDSANGVELEFSIAEGTLTLTWPNGGGATLRRPGGPN